MPVKIQGFPEVSSHVQAVVLGVTKYRVRFHYRDRTRSWYMDLTLLDGTAIVLGRRLSPGWGPMVGFQITDQPEGFMTTRGTDGYAKEDLGAALDILFVPDDEIPAAPSAGLALIVVV